MFLNSLYLHLFLILNNNSKFSVFPKPHTESLKKKCNSLYNPSSSAFPFQLQIFRHELNIDNPDKTHEWSRQWITLILIFKKRYKLELIIQNLSWQLELKRRNKFPPINGAKTFYTEAVGLELSGFREPWWTWMFGCHLPLSHIQSSWLMV